MSDVTVADPKPIVPFKPLAAPLDDYKGLATGIGTEHGVTAKGLVEAFNTHVGQLYAALEGAGVVIDDLAREDAEKVAGMARDALTRIEDIEKNLELLGKHVMDEVVAKVDAMRETIMEAVDAKMKEAVAPIEPQPPQPETEQQPA